MGKLNEPAELMADPFSSINIIKYENGRAGIQGIQRLSGAYHADVAAELTSRWRWDEGSWRIVNTELKQVGP